MKFYECVYSGQLCGIREYISLSVLVRSVKHNFMVVMYDILWFIWQYVVIMLGFLKSVSSYDKICSHYVRFLKSVSSYDKICSHYVRFFEIRFVL